MKATSSLVEQYYKTFNAAYFDNILPNDIKFGVTRSKKTWGLAGYSFKQNKSGKTNIRPTYIKITNAIDMSEWCFKSTILHEMIHILDYYTFPEHFESKRYDAHGEWFKKTAEKIYKKSGIHITAHVSKEEIDSSNYNQLKQQIADNGYLICVCKVRTSDKLFLFKTNKYYLEHSLIEGLKKITSDEYTEDEKGISRKSVFKRIDIYECHAMLLADTRAVSGKSERITGRWYKDIDVIKQKYQISNEYIATFDFD